MNKTLPSQHHRRSGVTAVMALIGMLVFLGLLAIVIDLGHLHAVRQELHNAADASALAGTRALFPLSLPATPPSAPLCGEGLQIARETAAANRSDKEQVTLPAADAKLIRWDWANNRFSPANPSCTLDANTGVNGVEVTTRSSNVTPGGVFLTFGRIFGVGSAEVVAKSAAAVGFVAGLPPGPFNNIAINKDYLASLTEGVTGLLSPDPGDNAAWCAGSPYNPDAGNLKNWLDNGSSPGVAGNGSVNINNGSLTSVLNAMKDALTRNYDPNLGGWLINIPVVGVTKMVQSTPVITFQPIIITNIQTSGNPKGIEFKLYEGPVVVPGTNPGGPPSPLYTLPKLVE